jgi:hypothetical protein
MTRLLSLVGFICLFAALDLASPMRPGSLPQPGESTEELWAGRRTSESATDRATWRPAGVVAAEKGPRQSAVQAQRRQAPVEVIRPVGRAHLPASPSEDF